MSTSGRVVVRRIESDPPNMRRISAERFEFGRPALEFALVDGDLAEKEGFGKGEEGL
jgi:hypothetical protein